MKKISFVIVLSIASLTICSAQKLYRGEEKNTGGPSRNVYGELGGPGFLSINYDQRFKAGDKGLGFKAGLGGIGFLTVGIFTLPVGINYLAGSNGHYAEFGVGASLITISDGETVFENENTTTFGYFSFGYRYQPIDKGLTGRIFVSPLITEAGVFPFYGGLSVGYKF